MLTPERIDQIKCCFWRKWDLIQKHWPECVCIQFRLFSHRLFRFAFAIRYPDSESFDPKLARFVGGITALSQARLEIIQEIEESIPGYRSIYDVDPQDPEDAAALRRACTVEREIFIPAPSSHEILVAWLGRVDGPTKEKETIENRPAQAVREECNR